MQEILASLGSDELYNELIKKNLDNRVLVINEDIDENVVENYILYILKWNREDRGKEEVTPITIYINTPGGSVCDGFGLVDVIRASSTPVKGVALGLVASMGLHIYLACDDRLAFSHSVLLMHDGETTVQNSTKKARDTMRFFEDMEERTKQFVLSRTSMTEEFYDKVYDQEFWMYANDKGKELGVVHKIIGEDCTLDEIL